MSGDVSTKFCRRSLGLARATGLRGDVRKIFPTLVVGELLPVEHLWIGEAVRTLLGN